MEKFQETFNKWRDVNCQLAKDCKAYIKDTLNKLPNKEVIFDGEEVITINYHGSHPEYDSNCFSRVECVYVKNGNIYVDTEDCSGYNIENLNAEETYWVAETMLKIIEKEYDFE